MRQAWKRGDHEVLRERKREMGLYPIVGGFGLLIWDIFLVVLTLNTTITLVLSKTDRHDVSALNVMYSSLGSPSQLDGWMSSGGDPCGDSWKGILCSGSSVTEIDLSGLGLTGSMGYQVSSLTSVSKFDLSKNNLKNDIPYQLPPNAVHLDLSDNGFTGSVPYSVSQMKDLKYLNLGHNELSGQLGEMFGQLSKLRELDLSFNKLTGNLPQTFGSLSSLTTLHLQNNQFTGSINLLADLPLNDLNVANNKFTGWIPDELKSINEIETGGNSWLSGPAPPPPPGKKSHSHANRSSKKGDERSGLHGAAIAGIVLCILLALGLIIFLFSRRSSTPPPTHFLDEERISQRKSFTPIASQEVPNGLHIDVRMDLRELKASESSSSFTAHPLQKSPSYGLRSTSSNRIKSFSNNEFSKRMSFGKGNSVQTTCYPLADLLTATSNFATGRLLGEGTIGRVYRAKYADGKVFAVKKIDSSLFQGGQGEEFPQIVSNISKLRHPNITELVGYCLEQGQNMLVYDYCRNGSLHEFLHLSDDFSKPLTWNTRVKIASGTARAVEYLHEVCLPSSVHMNIKSSNILLDTELNPHLSDSGLATFYQRTNQNLENGYNAPECITASAYSWKSDVYSFGVVMLELLTGRMPFDSSKPRAEQSLVRWATPQLHDIDTLGKMVDPALRGLYPPKSVSRFADIIALCVQSEPEFRPLMSEVVESLGRVVQQRSREDPNASCRMDEYDY